MTNEKGEGKKRASARMPLPPFRPSVHYRRRGDYFVFYWDEAQDFLDPVDGCNHLALLRAHHDRRLITGVRFNALSTVMSVPGMPPPDSAPDTIIKDGDPVAFRPYARYEPNKDELTIRWSDAPSAGDMITGHPRFTLLRKCGDECVIGP